MTTAILGREQGERAGSAAPIGLREAVAVLLKRRLRILAGLLLPLLVALALAVLMPKVYRAWSDILVKTGHEYLAQSEGESAMTAPTSTKQEGINSEMALLGDRAVAEATINAIGIDNLYPEIVESPPMSGSVLDAAVEKFGKNLKIDPVKLSNIISVSFDAPTPELAKAVLNKLIRIYIDKHREVFAGSRAEGYESAVRDTLQQVKTLEERRSRIKVDNGIYDIAAQRVAVINQRVDAQNHLQDALNRQAKLAARLDFLAKTRPRLAATATSTQTEKNDESVHAREALIDLRQTETAMAARYGAGNPDLQRVRAQIASLQRTIAGTGTQRTNVSTAPSPVVQQVDQEIVLGRAELATMQAEVDRFRALVAERTAELQRLEQADLELRTTVLQIDVLTDNLRAMQSRYEQARAQEQTELARQASVVQVAPAIASEKPVKPRKLILALAGVLGGILLAGGVGVLSLLTNKTALTEDGAERRLGLPVLAVLPVRSRQNGPITLELE